MPPGSHLTETPVISDRVRVVFASGIAELNHSMLEHFASLRPDLTLFVVSEFQPEAGEWIVWHVQRPFSQNLAYVKTALEGRTIESAAAAWDRRSALADLRKAAQLLAPRVLTAYDEDMRTASPHSLRGFLLRRAWRSIRKQLNSGGRARAWLRRIVHPTEAEIPLRARAAQARGLAASRTRRAFHVHRKANGIAASTPVVALPPLHASDAAGGVTVVIPSRDGLELLREMLPPLHSQLSEQPVPGEVIVVDNGSSDGTADWLAREYPEIRVLAHAAPLSFARAVNLGIREARCSRTLLLNNDMIVEPGFVHALGSAFGRVPDLFCATAQILFPAGVRREETGKAVWRRDSELDFPVRCDDPIAGEDLTWVLYGSGGCSLFDTAKLLALGGVSEIYEPAYVEDLDFGFRAWKRGWPTVYCEQARVEHRHRSTTARFYTGDRIDFFVEQNYLRFVANTVADPPLFERLWLESVRRLQLQAMAGRGVALDALRAIPHVNPTPPPVTGHLSEADIFALAAGDVAIFPGETNPRLRTVLIASPYLPFPLSHGGAVRIYNLMRLTAPETNFILIAFADELTAPADELRAICAEIVLVRRHGTHYRRNTARPDTVEEFDSPAFRAVLKQAVHQWRPDIVQLEFTWMAQYADACRPAKTILVEHDVTFDLQRQLLETMQPGGTDRLEQEQQLAKWRSFETAAWTNVDCVVSMSPEDSRMIEDSQTIAVAQSVECIPNGVDCERFQPSSATSEPRRLLLIGSFAHLPNLLALDFFLRDVWPLLGPGHVLHVIGGARHEYYLRFFRDRAPVDLSQPGVEVEGFVEDVRSAYKRASVVLAPLPVSAGTNIKVLEAMAMGKAVISTPAGVNGLDVTPGHEVALVKTAAEMAARIVQLENDSEIRRNLELGARRAALRFDWTSIAERQQTLYNQLFPQL